MIVPQVGSKNYAPTLYDLERAGFDVFAEPFGSWWDTFVPTHKPELIQKFMHTYYFHQIEGETPDRFRVYVNAQLERIMPYYNQLYASELIKFNPLLTHQMITRERSIENLVRLANSDKSSVGQALRDFVNNSRGTGRTTGMLDGNYEEHDTDHGTSTLDKTGKESIVENRKEKEDTGYDETTKVVTHSDQTDTEHTETTEDVTENPGKITTTDYGKTVHKEGDENVVTDEDENTTENPGKITTTQYGKSVDKSGHGQSDTSERETINKNGTDAYSDTPQKEIVKVDGKDELRVTLDYLTNYRATSDTTTRNDTTGVTNSYSDTEGQSGKDITTESGTNTKEKDTDTTTKKDYTDDVTDGGKDTVTESGVTTRHTDTEQDRTLTSEFDKTEDGTKHSDTDRTLNVDITTDKDWEEHAKGETWDTHDGTGKNHQDTEGTSLTTGFERGTDTGTTSKAEAEAKKEQQTKDDGSTIDQQGFSGIMVSDLLKAFRDTFLNIDSMILGELRENFMEVF